VHRAHIAIQLRITENIDGISPAPAGGQERVELLKRFRAERCRIEAPFAESIRRHDPWTTGVGDDGQLASGGPLHLAQGLRTTEELTDSVYPDDSRTAKRRIVGFILSGEGSGV
jgi:hypothetical protein